MDNCFKKIDKKIGKKVHSQLNVSEDMGAVGLFWSIYEKTQYIIISQLNESLMPIVKSNLRNDFIQ